MSEDEAHKGGVALEELWTVNGENVNRSELGNTVGQHSCIGGFGFVRNISQEAADGFCGSSKREVRFGGEHGR